MRRVHPRRIRRGLLLGLGLFIATQLVVGLLASRTLLWVREPLYGRKLARLKSRIGSRAAVPFTTVVVGSSRTFNGLRGDLVEPVVAEFLGRPAVVFNCGVAGADPITNLVHLRRLLADGVRPNLALIEAPMPLFFEGEADAALEENACPTSGLRWSELGEIQPYPGHRQPPRRLDWGVAQAVPLYSFRFNLLNRVAPQLLGPVSREDHLDAIDAWGWYPCGRLGVTAEHRRVAIAEARKLFGVRLQEARISKARLDALRETLRLCRRHGVPAAVFTMPEGPLFRSWYAPGAAEKLQAELEKLAQEERVPLISTRGWAESEEDFLDSHHLLVPAAAAYSRRFATDVLLPLVRRQQESHVAGRGRD